MNIQEINQDSPYLEQVIALGDAHSNTLGFLPREAFKEHAQKKRILVVLGDDKRLLGYLLYRVSHYRATIVHLCVDPTNRRSGIARELVKALREKTNYLSGIRLSCRRDYEAHKVWPEIGFVPLHDRPGRGKERKKLTVWWLDYGNPTLFSVSQQAIPTTKLKVAIDMNIFLDLQAHEERVDAKESQALLADWLQEEIELCVTEELQVEINRNQNAQQRDNNKVFAQEFPLLSSRPDDFEKALEKLQTFFPEKMGDNDRSDRRQLARTIASEVEFFVTRDDNLLQKQEALYEKLGLTIIRPSDLILYMDELQKQVAYRPQRLSGTGLNIRRVHAREQERLLMPFRCQNQQESTTEFRRKVQRFLSEPDRYESQIALDKNQKPLATFVYDTHNADVLEITLFRVRKGALGATLARHLIFQFLLKASQSQKVCTSVTDSFLEDEIKDALLEDSFVYTEDKWVKLTLSVAETAQQIAYRIQEYDVRLPEPFSAFATVLGNDDILKDTLKILDIERRLWPAKIVDADIPTYLLPIKLKWARHLFDAQFAGETLFGAEEELMLKRENVYYRSARSSLELGRILWYVSQDERHQWSGGIRACSYIDEVVVGKPKELFRRFRRIGIYKWEDVFRTAKEDLGKSIMGLRFSNTEPFKYPMPIVQLQQIFADEGSLFQPPQGPRRISKALFARLYRIGKGLD